VWVKLRFGGRVIGTNHISIGWVGLLAALVWFALIELALPLAVSDRDLDSS
jgi:hypothetical protein